MSAPFAIDKQFRITAIDERNWSLQERKLRTREGDGEKYEGWQDLGYSGTVEGILRLWAQRTVRRSEKPLPAALADAIRGMERVLKEIRTATKGL